MQHFACDLIFLCFVDPVTGETWTKRYDVADCLSYIEPAQAINEQIRNENFKRPLNDIVHCSTFRETPSNWQPDQTMINEGGIYNLIMSSSSPEVQRYKDSVCNTVLPFIKTANITFIVELILYLIKKKNKKNELLFQKIPAIVVDFQCISIYLIYFVSFVNVPVMTMY